MNNQPEQKTEANSSAWKRLMPLALLLIALAAFGITIFSPGESSAAAPVRQPRLVNTYPHDPDAFCQGLVMHRGALLETTGHYKKSKLRLVDIKTGKPSKDIRLNDNEFGEGVTVWKNTIVQLTWKNGYMITWDADTLSRTGTLSLKTIDPRMREGWGITHDGKHLIISDGTSTLRFVDPATLKLVRKLRVKDGLRFVSKLNELEFVDGEIFANVWYRDQIARINPETGSVNSWLELKQLRPESLRFSKEAVLNGIAWDATKKRLFVTGKNWPTMHEIAF